MSHRTQLVATLAGVVAVVGTGTAALAASASSSPERITVCYRTKSGILRYSPTGKCASGEKSVIVGRGDTGAVGRRGAVGDRGAVGPLGPKGDTGAAGSDGTDGVDGTNGHSLLIGSGTPDASLGNPGDVYVDSDGFDVYVNLAGTWTSEGNIKGAKGDQGEIGPQGPIGPRGLAGADGTNGAPGAPGTDGRNGVDGVNGLDGTNGVDGTNGLDGTNGRSLLSGAGTPDNAAGADGDTYIDATSGAVYTKSAGAWGLPIGNIKGVKGDIGLTGATGATGPTGAPGADGSTGPQGPAGDSAFHKVSVTETAHNGDAFYAMHPALCAPNEYVVSGGYSVAGPGITVVAAQAVGGVTGSHSNNAWQVTESNSSGSNQVVTTYVICTSAS